MLNKFYRFLSGVLLVTLMFLVAAFAEFKKMPTTVDVNGVNWSVEVTENLPPSYNGYTTCQTRHIEISSKARSPHTVLMHELMHAMVCQDSAHNFTVNNLYYNSKTNEDHEGIYKTSELWGRVVATQSTPRLLPGNEMSTHGS